MFTKNKKDQSGVASVLGSEDRRFDSSIPKEIRRIIMRKSFIILVMCINILSITSTSFADRWVAGWGNPLRQNAGNTSEIMGEHIVVRDVYVVDEHIVNGKAVYMYKLIIQRPSNDNGTGVAPWGPADTRLYYWAGRWDKNSYFSLRKDKAVVQVPFKGNSRLIVVWNPHGMTPSRTPQYIRVGAFPSPMIFGYDLRRIIQTEEGMRKYIGYLELLVKFTSFPGLVLSYFGEELKNQTVDSLLSKWITIYGQIIEIEVRTSIPNITGKTIKQADKLLRERYLIPLMVGKVYTPERHRWGKVRRLIGHYNVIDRNRILPQTQIRYEAWTSTQPGNQNPQPTTPGPSIQPIKKPSASNQGNQIYTAFYVIRCTACAADFRVADEATFKKYKNKNIVILGRGRTGKEAIQQACSQLRKVKTHIGLTYKHNGHYIRSIGSRCNCVGSDCN